MKRKRIATVVQLQLFEAIPKFVYLHKSSKPRRAAPVAQAKANPHLAKSARGNGAGEDPVDDNTVKFLQSINYMS